jgi:hypothetical protein
VKNKVILFAESPWDSECYRKVFGEDIHSIYLYDYAKVGQRTKLFRAFYFAYILLLFSSYILRGYKILVSDMNREGLSLLNLGYKKTYAFIPNLLVKGVDNPRYAFRNKVLDNLISKDRIYFSDTVTSKLFNYDNNSVPAAFELDGSNDVVLDDQFLYLIILPGTFSHHQTKENASSSYQYLLKIGFELIDQGFNVKFKPHPRDWTLCKESVLSLVPAHLICQNSSYSDVIVYISYFSSVSLNKRYGKGFGFWLCDVSAMAKKEGLEELFPFSISKSIFFNKIAS